MQSVMWGKIKYVLGVKLRPIEGKLLRTTNDCFDHHQPIAVRY